jgi:hypothetical protein
MRSYVAALLVMLLLGVVGVLAVEAGYAQDEAAQNEAAGAKCSKATLDGRYLFAEEGVILTGNDQVPFALAGYQEYNGNGKVEGVQSGNFGGEVVRNERFAGTYTVKANCTATVTYTDGEPFRFDLFIAPDGSKFTLVQTNPSEWVTSGFELRVTAKRVAQ